MLPPLRVDLKSVPAHLRNKAMRNIAQAICEAIPKESRKQITLRECLVKPKSGRECSIEIDVGPNLSAFVLLKIRAGLLEIDPFAHYEPPDPWDGFWGNVRYLLSGLIAIVVSWRATTPFIQYEIVSGERFSRWVLVVVNVVSLLVGIAIVLLAFQLIDWLLFGWARSRARSRGRQAASELTLELRKVIRARDWLDRLFDRDS